MNWMFKIFLKVKYLNLFLLIFIFFPDNFNKVISSNLNLKNRTDFQEYSTNNGPSEIYKSDYLLGPGDHLFINFNSAPIFSGIYQINPESSIFLPELNRFKVDEISVEELEKKLNQKYKEFIFNPDIRVSIQSYRDVNVYIRGAIRKPGLYSFKVGFINSNKNSSSSFSSSIVENNYISTNSPVKVEGQTFKTTKIYDVIKAAKGFNANADLTNVVVIRNNSKEQGGGKIYTNVNLLSLLLEGEQSQNIRIHDGDNIVIKDGININQQILNLNRNNISPETISVYISGNVFSSGRKEIKQGSSLLQALATAGGEKNLTGYIQFLRFNIDGTVEKRKFKINNQAPINSPKNPILIEGDIINVERSLLGKTTSALSEISNPIITGLTLYNIFSD